MDIMTADAKDKTHVILVAWSDREEEGWQRMKDTLSETLNRVLRKESAPRSDVPYDPFEGLTRRVLGTPGDVRVLYCSEDLSPVEETVRHAIGQGALKVMVCPLLLALDAQVKEGPPGWLASARKLRELERAHPDVTLLYAGPPFPQGSDMETVLEKIREDEPDAAERLKHVVKLGFQGDWDLFAAFMRTLQTALPPETRVAIRGSTVTGVNAQTGIPFDGRGPGTSDLDLALVGETALSRWSEDGFYIRGALTMPLGDEDPALAPWLEPTRRTLQQMVRRPVHVQAMSPWLLEVRRSLLGMPYLFLDA